LAAPREAAQPRSPAFENLAALADASKFSAANSAEAHDTPAGSPYFAF
jgi:hypothetical protein